MRLKDVVKMEKELVVKVVKDETLSKSERIRQLFNGGYEVNEIKDLVGVRYNFVYNVVKNHVLMNGLEIEKSERVSRKGDIIELLKSGMTITEVATELKSNYNYIWKINKENKDEIEKAVAALKTPKKEAKAAPKKETKKAAK